MTTNTERQAAFKARRRAAGKKQITVWVTSEEERAIKAILADESLPVTIQPKPPPATPPRPERPRLEPDIPPPPIVHYRYIDRPLCGQRDSRGKGWARGNYSTEIKDVTCKKCRRAFEKQQEQGTPQPLPGKITIRPGQQENETQVLRDGKHIGSVYKRRVDGHPRPKTRWEAYRYGRILLLGSYRTKREAVAALSS